MGTGSIAGVATALTLGGPGAVFWMWVSALLGMMTGCGEKLLSVGTSAPAPGGALQGGPMFYLRDGSSSPCWRVVLPWPVCPPPWRGAVWSSPPPSPPPWRPPSAGHRAWWGLVLALLAGLVMVGGIGRIARVSSALVPVMALLYLGSGGGSSPAATWTASRRPGAHLLLRPLPRRRPGRRGRVDGGLRLRYGVARGVFTNEAGLGTSAMAHGAARVDHPARQGMWGIFEVFLSTLVVCTVTALVILVSGLWPLRGPPHSRAPPSPPPPSPGAGSRGAGRGGPEPSPLCLLLHSGLELLRPAVPALSGGERPVSLPYRAVFLLCVLAGAVWEPAAVWLLVDLCNALMALPNLTALLLLAPQALAQLDPRVSLTPDFTYILHGTGRTFYTVPSIMEETVCSCWMIAPFGASIPFFGQY